MKILFNFLFLAFVFLFASSNLIGQTKYGNEWIDLSKTYLKIKVAENAIYRITFEELKDAGFINSNINGQALKLINYGSEQAIHVSNNSFGPGAYLEFYGEKNTIGLDSLLYNDWKKDLFNPEYSLVSDSNAYFLTLAPETTNKRYTQISPDYNSINLTPFSYYLHEEKIVFTTGFYKHVESDVRYSNFEPSEGFGSGITSISTLNFPVTFMDNNGPKPILSLRTGTNSSGSKLEISWNGNILESRNIAPKINSQFTYTMDFASVNASNTLNIKNVLSTVDRHRVAYGQLLYPRRPEFNNQSSYRFLMPSASSLRLLEINKFKTDNKPVFLYDPQANIRYATQVNGDNVKVRLNPNSNEAHYILVSESGIKKVGSLVKFTPKTFANKDQQYLIISNKTLYQFGPNYVEDYANYRSSEVGGNFKTEIVEVQDIYDNFGYGIDYHFYSFKQMTKYMKENWKNLEYVFIIGKALEYNSMRTQNDVINNKDRVFFVPTFGYAGSDNMLFSEGNRRDPEFAIGRLAATTSTDIKNYLDKIIQFDQAQKGPQTVENKLWMKRIMHLGGGDTESLQNQIKSALLNLGNIVENNKFGANVFPFFKTSSDPIQVSTSEQLLKLIDDGVSMITFFGHSGPNTFDFAIENPDKFNNSGKYHLVNSLGCYAGNIHSKGKSISEAFVLEKQKGAIVFIASSGTAFVPDLNQYGTEFYNFIGDKNENYSLGQIVKLINKQFASSSTLGQITLYQQLTFHGDPAVKLYKEEFPDYTFDPSTSKIDEKIITTATEKINFNVNLINLGANIHQNIYLKSELIGPDGKSNQIRLDTIYMDKSQKLITLEFNLQGENTAGINKILSTIDPENKIIEGPEPGAKQNNILLNDTRIGFEFFVSNNDVRPIYPQNFSIVNKSSTPLVAVIADLFAKKTKYFFEIDTTALFNSPILKKTEIIQNNGGSISWISGVNYVPNKVYYWRVAPEPESNEGIQWRNSSFIYLPNSPSGWNQSHLYQLKENRFKNTKINDQTRKLEYVKNLNTAIITNGLFPNIKPIIQVNANIFEYIPWDAPVLGGIYVSVFDPINGKYWENKFPALYESTMNSPWATGWGIFPYHTNTSEGRKKLINFLENVIPDGHIVTIFSVQRNDLSPKMNYDSDKWDDDKSITGKTLFEVFEKQGIKNLRSTINTKLPFTLVYKKGDKSYTPTEDYAQSENQELRTIVNIETFWNEGDMNSTKIGPASKWNKVIWSESDKNPNEDFTNLNIYGIKTSGIQDTLFTNISSFEKDLDIVDPSIYPYLRLEYKTKDDIKRTSSNVPFWRVLYDGFPELVVDGSNGFEFYKDTLNQGETLKVKFNVLNASASTALPFDIDFTVKQPENKQIQNVRSINGLNAFESKVTEYQYNTSPYFGDHALLINLDKANITKDVIKSNNLSSKNFFVTKDNKAPLLDVTFDGVRIMNEDIVSANPQINIVVSDESSFLKMDDISLLEVKLFTDRNKEIPVLQNELSLIKAENQKMQVLYTPMLPDGDYRLEVQARDKSGNKSGVNPYSINFKVINKSSVSQVLNYPNPFSTNTQFVFTLTGREVPENVSIIIYTLSGKVVKEITKQDLGPLRIGVNKTEYKWDGTDDFGSKLANGVYLYKVNFKDKEGKAFENFKTKSDTLFKDGFGKMVIIR